MGGGPVITGLIVMGSAAAYTTCATLTGQYWYRISLEDIAQQKLASRLRAGRDIPLVNDGDREAESVPAFWIGVFWPVVLVVWGMVELFSGKGDPYVPPTERERLDRIEFERLREQAQRLGLPMGDES
jgi:hypothetical protein